MHKSPLVEPHKLCLLQTLSLHISLGLARVPERWYATGIRNAVVRSHAECGRIYKKPPLLTAIQKKILSDRIKAALVGRDGVNPMRLYDEFLTVQKSRGIEMLPMDTSFNMINKYYFRDFVNDIRSPAQKKQASKSFFYTYSIKEILRMSAEGKSTKEIAAHFDMPPPRIRVIITTHGGKPVIRRYRSKNAKYGFGDIKDFKTLTFDTKADAVACQNAASFAGKGNKNRTRKYSTRITQEGDVFLCKITVVEIK